ncbi:MAG: PD-(D/E)XK nuclease family protein [Novosphingobium sp.]
MPERPGPQVYSIAAHRGFADALAAGLLPRYAEPDFGLARLTLLLPSQRAARTVTEAFVRLAEGGLLLPRMAVVGDLDLDEALGALLDPLGAGAEVPPAADPTRRWLRLARFLAEVDPEQAGRGASLLRRARDIARTMDRLLVEGIAPGNLASDHVAGIVGEQASHWRDSTVSFLRVQAHWRLELEARGEVDAPTRRNLLFERAARRWREQPPAHPIVAAGVTSASPALARLLRVISELPQGAVVLPDLDLAMDDQTWASLGTAGAPEDRDDPPFGRGDAVTHPQYHLKLLLNRMGVRREEVRPWHRSGPAAAPPARSLAISNLFVPPAASARWAELTPDQRRLSGVRLMESAHPGEEAQALAILIREALEVPERRVALVTPDRGLAARVVAQLKRWGIEADDSAGQPLPQTAAGRVLLLLAEVMAERAAPVPLLALLGHPLARAGEGRAQWLENVRKLDLALRGPRPAPGLEPLRALAAKAGIGEWWDETERLLAPLMAFGDDAPLAAMLDTLAVLGEALCGEELWSRADGRALSGFVEQLRDAAGDEDSRLDPRELHAALRDAMDQVAVRPPWGGHPRLAIYGLLEARMARADLVLCGGLTEGVWPASPAPDPLLPPALLRVLGVPGADFRIGLAAHDLAGALGAPEVVLSWARRDEGGPVIPSRFVLRIKAMLGRHADELEEKATPQLARLIDDAPLAERYPRPRPRPSAGQRLVDVSATGLDRLRSDPYAFYANSILRLRVLDALDAEPSAAWRGDAVHKILERWHKAGDRPEDLLAIAETTLEEMNAHPLMRGLWRPRLLEALKWIGQEVADLACEGRTVAASEATGAMQFKGIRVHGRADRIDRLADGGLVIADYKTGTVPTRKEVAMGYRLQLGLLGLITRAGGFDRIGGKPAAFEYWGLGRDLSRRDEQGFGFRFDVLKPKRGAQTAPEDFLASTEAYLADAIDRWILGSDPFTARLNLDVAGYNDYDQLMRLDEWLLKLTPEERDEA